MTTVTTSTLCPPKPVAPDLQPTSLILPASAFTLETLTDAYNQTRIDYIVPMPMNVARLQQYIHNYDVQLEHSAVALEEDQILGLAMLGVRLPRTWITRLGMLPVKRRRGTGQRLMEYLIARSEALQAEQIILEVIQNNIPAHTLFRKLGFQETRDLLVIRRPPRAPIPAAPAYSARLLEADTALPLLQRRRSVPSWLDETPSLYHAGNMKGLEVHLDSGDWGWAVFQHTPFQLGRLVLQAETANEDAVVRALLHALHTAYPHHDTKHENLPAADPYWPILQDFGYLLSFTRIEMVLPLRSMQTYSHA